MPTKTASPPFLPRIVSAVLAWLLAVMPATVAQPVSTSKPVVTRVQSIPTARNALGEEQARGELIAPSQAPAGWLNSTMEANHEDRFVREALVGIGSGVANAFHFVRDQIGYEAYSGSLRGARGTLWSWAGNSLDQASLLVALLRCQGIGARYVRGTLADPHAQALLRSLFDPAVAASAVGYVPPRYPRSDPETRADLLAEARDHWWVELEDGTVLDPCFGDAEPGEARGLATATHLAVPAAERHEVVVRLEVELHNPLSQYSRETPLEATLATSAVYGRSLTLGHFLSVYQPPALIGGFKTYTYSPYLMVDDNDSELDNNHLIRGQDYQEFLTSFLPLANSILTRLTLEFEVRGPGREVETRRRDLLDRVGFAARHGLAQPGGVDTAQPALNELDLTTFFILPGLGVTNLVTDAQAGLAGLQPELEGLAAAVASLADTPPAALTPADRTALQRYGALNRQMLIRGSQIVAGAFLLDSDWYLQTMRRSHQMSAYYDSPRITLFEVNALTNGEESALRMGLDLRRNHVRAIPYPGQNTDGALHFNMAKGRVDSILECLVVERLLADDFPEVRRVASPVRALEAAKASGVPLAALHGPQDIPTVLERLELSPETKARVALALQAGCQINVPVRMTELDGQSAIGWWEIDSATGEAIAVGEDGGRQNLMEFALISALVASASALSLVIFGDAIRAFFSPSSSVAQYEPPSPINRPGSNPVFHTEVVQHTLQSVPSTHGESGGMNISFNPDGSLTIRTSDLLETVTTSTSQNLFPVIDAVGASGSIIDFTGTDLEVIAHYAPAPPTGLGEVVEEDGVKLELLPDPGFVVKHQETQVPSVYRVLLTNTGEEPATFTLGGVPPADWRFLFARTNLVIPAGATGQASLFLQPQEETVLPPPGAQLDFTLAVESEAETTAATAHGPARVRPASDDSAVVELPVTFTMPEVHRVRLQVTPTERFSSPHGINLLELELVNMGNRVETVELDLPVPTGFRLEGAPTMVDLLVGQTFTETVTLVAEGLPLNRDFRATWTGTYGPDHGIVERVELTLHVVAPGADPAAKAAADAHAAGRDGLVGVLEALALDLTALYTEPENAVLRGRVLSGLRGLTRHLNDPLLAPFVDELTAVGAAIETAASSELPAILEWLGVALDSLAARLRLLRDHDFSLALLPNVAETLPETPTEFRVTLDNRGKHVTTYQIEVSGVPEEVSSEIVHAEVTLAPGGTTAAAGATTPAIVLTQPADRLSPFEFTVRVNVMGQPELTRSVPGSFVARSELVRVAAVELTPPFLEPLDQGTPLETSIAVRLLNAVNVDRTVLVEFTVSDSAGQSLYTSPRHPVPLSVLSSLETYSLGTFDAEGLGAGTYPVTVAVYETDGRPLAGASGTTSLLMGLPIEVKTTLSTEILSAGESTVTHRIEVTALPDFAAEPLTLLGLIDTPGIAQNLALHGDYVYVGGSQNVTVLNVADPRNPILAGTLIEASRWAAVTGDRLVLFPRCEVYSLENPAAPVLLGSSGQEVANTGLMDFLVTEHGAHALTLVMGWRNFDSRLLFVRGDVVSFDIRTPTEPRFLGLLFNTSHSQYSQFPGSDSFLGTRMAVKDGWLFLASGTEPGSGQSGTGRLILVDVSEPGRVETNGEFRVPGTTLLAGLAIQGDQALVVGSTDGFAEYGLELEGDVVLAVLDVADPAQPKLLGQPRVLPDSHLGEYWTRTMMRVRAGGDGLFILSGVEFEGEQPLLIVDTRDPDDVRVHSATTPTPVQWTEVRGQLLFTASSSGLAIYDLGGVLGIPLTTTVRIPKTNQVALVADSYSRPPNEIQVGADHDTLVWRTRLSAQQPSEVMTWQSRVTDLRPGELRRVLDGGTVEFTALGHEASLALAPQLVMGARLLALDPPRQTVQLGEPATYQVTLTNVTDAPAHYTLRVGGLSAEWVTLASSVELPAHGTGTFPLTVRSHAGAANREHAFTISAESITAPSDTIGGQLVLVGPATTAIATHGLVISLEPIEAVAGRGTPASIKARITNTGNTAERCELVVQAPEGVGFGGAPALEVPPGVENYREVEIVLETALGARPGTNPFAVTVSSAFTEASVSGILNVLPLGLGLSLMPERGPVTTVFTAQITNPNPTAETFDLTIGGPLASVAALASSQVTVSPGGTATVNLALNNIDFALAGNYPLHLGATARSDPRIEAFVASVVEVPETRELELELAPACVAAGGPGVMDALLLVHNRGNVEETVRLWRDSLQGPFTLTLHLPDGQLVEAVDAVRLPALGSGAILVRTDAGEFGTGVVRLRAVSAADTNIHATVELAVAVGCFLRFNKELVMELTFDPLSGVDHYVESKRSPFPGAPWEELPGGPYNAGYYLLCTPLNCDRFTPDVSDTVNPFLDFGHHAQRYYRLRTTGDQPVNPRMRLVWADALRYDTLCGFDHYVQVTANPGNPASWQDLPNGPHNGGLVIYTKAHGTRFFRVQLMEPQPGRSHDGG
jgi:large repetitive protein